MTFNFEFQITTSKKGHSILKRLSGTDDSEDEKNKKGKVKNIKAPFTTMSHAYLFAFILGLIAGQKIIIKETGGNFHFSSIQNAAGERYELRTLLQIFGKPGDMETKENARTAIMEYTTWGLLELDKQKFGDNDYRLGEYLNHLS